MLIQLYSIVHTPCAVRPPDQFLTALGPRENGSSPPCTFFTCNDDIIACRADLFHQSHCSEVLEITNIIMSNSLRKCTISWFGVYFYSAGTPPWEPAAIGCDGEPGDTFYSSGQIAKSHAVKKVGKVFGEEEGGLNVTGLRRQKSEQDILGIFDSGKSMRGYILTYPRF